jgi:hypothetical protein
MVNGVVRPVLSAGGEVDSGKNVTVESEGPMPESFAWLREGGGRMAFGRRGSVAVLELRHGAEG